MTRLIIIRHCQTIDNASGKMQGYSNDSEFSEWGKIQARKLAARLKNENIKKVYCSDLGRTITTARIIALEHNLDPVLIKDLRECDIGDWSDLPVKEAIQKWIKYYDSQKAAGFLRENIRPPNGENSFDHQKRVMSAIKKIVDENANNTVVVVGHGGTNRVIIGSFENIDPDNFYEVGQDNACINIIETNGNESKVIVVNDTTHLNNETD